MVKARQAGARPEGIGGEERMTKMLAGRLAELLRACGLPEMEKPATRDTGGGLQAGESAGG